MGSIKGTMGRMNLTVIAFKEAVIKYNEIELQEKMNQA